MTKLETWVATHAPKKDGLRALADATGVSYQSVQQWLLRGRVPVSRIAAVARVTGIPPSDLNPHVAELLKGIAA